MKPILSISKTICLLLLAFTITHQLRAQKAHDVLEDGICIGKDENIYLRYDAGLKYSPVQDPKRSHTFSDSVIFIIKGDGVNIYLAPLNPLNLSYKNEITFITDPINESANTALTQVTNLLATVNPTPFNPQAKAKPEPQLADCLTKTNSLLKHIRDSLAADQKAGINKVFASLKAMTFANETLTVAELTKVATQITAIEKHFTAISDSLKKLDANIPAYTCDSRQTDPIIVKYVYGNISKELTALKNEQMKRLTSLKAAYALVEDAQKKASVNGWWFSLGEANPKKNKIALFTISIFESGYMLSDSGEIVVVTPKEKEKKVMRFRNFQLFVPEVSAGVAYTYLTFPKFGTATDSAGTIRVASAGSDMVRRVNFTAMVNFNLYLSKSPVHPFWQVGVGANSGFPTLFTGVGMRVNVGNTRFAFSTGYASTWVKTLDKLSIGDQISGDAELEKDIKYEFNWPLKPYIGIQLNF
jgi:hypothetical protein